MNGQKGFTGRFGALALGFWRDWRRFSGWALEVAEAEWNLSVEKLESFQPVFRNKHCIPCQTNPTIQTLSRNPLAVAAVFPALFFVTFRYSALEQLNVPASLAWLSADENDGFSPKALVPHHVKSCLIRRGSESPFASMCL